MKEISISDTTIEIYEYVFPQFINPANTLFGGKMLYMLSQASILSANRVAQGPVVMGSMDSVDFIEPVQSGDTLIFRSRVQATFNSSLEVGVTVFKKTLNDDLKVVTLAHFGYVAIDENGKPRKLNVKVTPKDEKEKQIYEWGLRRRNYRLERIKNRRLEINDIDISKKPTYSLYSSKLIFPYEIVYNFMFAGYLFEKIDELGAILAVQYARNPTFTASVDNFDFFSPVRLGDILHFYLGINYIGNRSMEIGVKIIKEEALTGRKYKVASSYMTFVSLEKLKSFNPWKDYELERWRAAESRKFLRLERVKKFRECINQNITEPIC
ncbi:MAG: hotdog domain-containing protein [candidate division WOR-3 bacterium]